MRLTPLFGVGDHENVTVSSGVVGCVGSTARRITRWIPIATWFVAVALVISALAIGHWIAMPRPDKRAAKLAAGLSELLRGSSGWAAVHVLAPDCRCSQRVLDHLVSSQRPASLHEAALVVGSDPDFQARLSSRGFAVVTVAPESLYERFGIESVPLFILVDPAGAVRYAGGYTLRQQGPDLEDVAIVRDIRAGIAKRELPVFGCAVSRRLKGYADPLGFKR